MKVVILKIYVFFCAVFMFGTNLIIAQAIQENQPKMKVGVLRIACHDFQNVEMQKVKNKFYTQLRKNAQVTVVEEESVRMQLLPLGIKPEEISNTSGYIHAGEILKVDFIMVGDFDKIGDFVEVTFQVYTMPKGTTRKYPGGKTFNILLEQEIPEIVENIYRDMNIEFVNSVQFPASESGMPDSETPEKKKMPWMLITIGGVATGITASLIFMNNRDKDSPDVLPRPPFVPE